MKTYHEISDLQDNGRGNRPIIVQFQNSALIEGEESHLKSAILKKRKNTIVAVAAKEILYTGRVHKDNNDLYNRFLLAHNKRTGKVRLIAVDTAVVKAKFAEREVVDREESGNATSILNKQFGSKKIKRITEQRERLQMNIEAVKDQLEETVAAVDLNESVPYTRASENDSLYRPRIHRDAATREQVYLLEEIVPHDVLDSLEEEAASVLHDLNSAKLNEFISQCVKNLDSKQLEKCKLLLYVDYLMKYVVTPAKNITKKYVACNTSQIVNNFILDNYCVTSNTGRTRPYSIRDKTVCTILVLLMIGLGYELDIEAVSKHLKIGVKKLLEMGRILAFSSHGKNKNVMVLKIPLPAAVSASPKKSRK